MKHCSATHGNGALKTKGIPVGICPAVPMVAVCHSPGESRHSLFLPFAKGRGGEAVQFVPKAPWTILKDQMEGERHETEDEIPSPFGLLV